MGRIYVSVMYRFGLPYSYLLVVWGFGRHSLLSFFPLRFLPISFFFASLPFVVRAIGFSFSFSFAKRDRTPHLEGEGTEQDRQFVSHRWGSNDSRWDMYDNGALL